MFDLEFSAFFIVKNVINLMLNSTKIGRIVCVLVLNTYICKIIKKCGSSQIVYCLEFSAGNSGNNFRKSF